MKETWYTVLGIDVDLSTNELRSCYVMDGDHYWLLKTEKEAMAVCKDIAKCTFRDLKAEDGCDPVMEKVEGGYKIIDNQLGEVTIYRVHPIVIEY